MKTKVRRVVDTAMPGIGRHSSRARQRTLKRRRRRKKLKISKTKKGEQFLSLSPRSLHLSLSNSKHSSVTDVCKKKKKEKNTTDHCCTVLLTTENGLMYLL